jgi:nucleotide-binding universal stress UspA family protein
MNAGMQTELPRILVGVDFSESSDRAFGEAQQLAVQMGAQIDFVHIAPLPLPVMTGSVDDWPLERVRRRLESLERNARSDGFAAKSHLGVGDASAGLLAFVDRLKPALVVVGRHGRGAVMRLILGSVAESLIRHAHVPVLVVPAEEQQLAATG